MKKILLTALVLASLGLHGQVPTTGLFARYPLSTPNWISENTAPATIEWDLINGTLAGPAVAPNTEIGGAADFTTNHLMISRGLENPLGKNGYAYSFWINIPLALTTGQPTVLRVGESIAFQLEMQDGGPRSADNADGNGTQGANPYYLEFTTMHYDSLSSWQGNFNKQVWTNDGSDNLVDATDWIHVAVVYQGNPQTNSGTQTVYLNGQYAYQINTAHSAVIANETYESNVRTIRIGGDVTAYSLSAYFIDFDRFFTGQLDEVYVYTQAITANDVAAIYQQGAPTAPVLTASSDTVYYCDGVFNPVAVNMSLNAQYTVTYSQNGVVDTTYTGPGSSAFFFPTEAGQSTIAVTNVEGTTTVNFAVLPSNLNQLAITEVDGFLVLNETPNQLYGSYNYIDWYKDGVFVSTGISIPVSGPGSYTAYIYYQGDAPFCTRTTDAFIVTSVDANVVANSISLFPNPATNMVTISTPQNIASINVYDVAGKLVMSQNYNQSNNIIIDIATLSNGFYTVQMLTAKGEMVTKKLIKQ
ncbi:MAG: T9SS type A sorting domain-containing protein [Sphingobacteriales bacterium JAD_PAG50586_3]|nr:MAG: T9SS type A sorting domain-containing protein [Sphingobacteriales bacterium JAD_PAG50586_3]